MNTATVTEYNSVDLATKINAEIANGNTVKINGEEVVGYSKKVIAHMNGTLSYEVPAKAKGKTRTAYLKAGRSFNWTATAA